MKVNRNRRSVVIPIASLFAAAALVVAIMPGVSSATTKKKVVKEAPFTLPVLADVSGAGQPYSASDRFAYQLAANQINAAGGIDGHKLLFKFYDDTSSPTTAAELIRSIGSKALIIAQTELSSVATAVDPVAKELKLPAVTSDVSDATIISSGQPWVFDTSIPGQVELPPLLPLWVSKNPSMKNIAILEDTQNSAGLLQGYLATAALKNITGINVSQVVNTQTNLPSYQAQAAEIAAGKPDGVVVDGLLNEAATMIQDLRAAGFNGPIFATTLCVGSAMPALLGNNVSNVDFAWYWWPTLPGAATAKFSTAYEKLSNGAVPSPTSPWAFDTVHIIANCLRSTKVLEDKASVKLQTKRNQLIKCISTAKATGPNGTFKIGKDGYFVGAGTLLAFSDGNFTIVK